MAEAAAVRAAFAGVAEARAGDEAFVQTCTELCTEHGVSGEELAAQWEVLAINSPQLDGDALLRKLKETLAREQQRQDAKRRAGGGDGAGSVAGAAAQAADASVRSPALTTRTIRRLPGHGRRVDDFAAKFGVNLDGATANASPSKRRAAPAGSDAKRPRIPAPSSPLAGPGTPLAAPTSPLAASSDYTGRKDAGKVEAAFNADLVLASASSAAAAAEKKAVKPVTTVEPYKYMYATIEARAIELEAQLLEAKESLMRIHGWAEEDFCPVGAASQTQVLVCGRICCEAPTGKLNSKSLVLEGSRADSNGQRVKLEVDSSLTGYAFFPGQIVAVRGVCAAGDILHAKEVFSALRPPRASLTRQQALRLAAPDSGSRQPLAVMTACGPFTTQADLEYDPLEDLLAQVAAAVPDVLVLMGPFVDADHPLIAAGDCKRSIEGMDVVLSFQDMFDLVLSRVAAAVDGQKTRVVLVPSVKDVTHHAAFPQPPFKCSLAAIGASDPSQFVFASNPCMVAVEDVVIGVTTQDVVFDLARDDAAKIDPTKPKKGRITRLADHLVNSASFYPLFPPAADAQLDFLQRSALEMPVQPDVLFLSSKLRHFAHESEGTLFVNPGKLSRGKTGGMYAKLFVNPRSEKEVAAAPALPQAEDEDATQAAATQEAEERIANDVPRRAKLEILRI